MTAGILILISLWLIICFLCYKAGFFYGLKKRPETPSKPTPVPLSAEQERQIERLAREMRNFWSYDGSSNQEDFDA